jgi:hypothetical protein
MSFGNKPSQCSCFCWGYGNLTVSQIFTSIFCSPWLDLQQEEVQSSFLEAVYSFVLLAVRVFYLRVLLAFVGAGEFVIGIGVLAVALIDVPLGQIKVQFHDTAAKKRCT